MHGPRSGMPWRFSRGGIGGCSSPSSRPMTATRFWSFGQWNWYAYESAVPSSPGLSPFVRYWSQAGSCVGCAARGRLEVEPGHDDDAVVVARRVDRRLDLAELAQLA